MKAFKKFIWLIVFVLSIGFAAAAVNTQYFGKAPDLRISISMQDPDPVEPGKEVEASFKKVTRATPNISMASPVNCS
jgi:hypothetical protein